MKKMDDVEISPRSVLEALVGCAHCSKMEPLCVCEALTTVHDNKIFVLVLRHPQEQDRELGTARLLTAQLQNSLLRTGLSWASLSKALGRTVESKRWGVLYLGMAKSAVDLPRQPLTILTQKGNVAPDHAERLLGLEGIILLDGTWQQAKALWWRNPWLLKCQRLVLQPPQKSLYGNLRKEPRRESVSTLEAATYSLNVLEPDVSWIEKIFPAFKLLIYRSKNKNTSQVNLKNGL
jgi:DTW domain-containing protein YfiP